MLQNQLHDLERFWLERRIHFLHELERLTEADAHYDDYASLAADFAAVEKPSDLISKLKDIYKEDFQ